MCAQGNDRVNILKRCLIDQADVAVIQQGEARCVITEGLQTWTMVAMGGGHTTLPKSGTVTDSVKNDRPGDIGIKKNHEKKRTENERIFYGYPFANTVLQSGGGIQDLSWITAQTKGANFTITCRLAWKEGFSCDDYIAAPLNLWPQSIYCGHSEWAQRWLDVSCKRRIVWINLDQKALPHHIDSLSCLPSIVALRRPFWRSRTYLDRRV